MSDFDVLDIFLVPPRIWEKQFRDAAQLLSPDQSQVMRQSLLTLHDQHIGITPKLMADLTPSLLDPALRVRQGNAWFPILDRLQRSLSADGRANLHQSRSEKVGILLTSQPEYVLLRIVAPLIDIACRQIGRAYLFCGDEDDARITEPQYVQYSNDLKATLETVAADENNPILDLFWQERAAVLASYSHPDADSEQVGSIVPDSNHLSAALFLRLRPDLGERLEEQKLRRLTILRRLRSTQQKEAGVAGIRVTKREEDLGNALLSEYLNDKVTRMDRFFNTGYFALEREPKRTKLRDVLLVGLLPGDLYNTMEGDFVKACWFDLTVRLGHILRQLGLERTEFRWVEGDLTGYVRNESFFLKNIPDVMAAVDGVPPERFRKGFVTSLRWLPSYLDTHAPMHRLGGWNPGITEQSNSWNSIEESPAQRWLTAAWRAQVEAMEWSREDMSSQTNHLHADDFVYTHIVAFLPVNQRTEPDSKNGTEGFATHNLLAWLTGRLQAASHFTGGVSITWVPNTVDTLDSWYFDAPQRVQSRLFPENNPELQIEKLAGRLVRSWMEQIIKEVSRV